MNAHPPIVDRATWLTARAELLQEEKRLTHELDALAARRRRLPMVPLPGEYTFTGPAGPVRLLDLFGAHDQLVVYLHMDVGPDGYCPGCTWFTHEVHHLEGLSSDFGAAWVTLSEMPIEQMTRRWQEMGWDVPYASCRDTGFATDIGAVGFMLTTLLRVGDQVYQTYATESRGVDRLMFTTAVADLLPYGRQETWEDSPEGWPRR